MLSRGISVCACWQCTLGIYNEPRGSRVIRICKLVWRCRLLSCHRMRPFQLECTRDQLESGITRRLSAPAHISTVHTPQHSARHTHTHTPASRLETLFYIYNPSIRLSIYPSIFFAHYSLACVSWGRWPAGRERKSWNGIQSSTRSSIQLCWFMRCTQTPLSLAPLVTACGIFPGLLSMKQCHADKQDNQEEGFICSNTVSEGGVREIYMLINTEVMMELLLWFMG